MGCNFKFVSSDGTENHILTLDVVCIRLASLKGYTYGYRVQATAVGSGRVVYLSSKNSDVAEWFNTPEEAYAFHDKIIKKYPQYHDDRDFDIGLAPLYEGIEM